MALNLHIVGILLDPAPITYKKDQMIFVYPGDTLTISGWNVDGGKWIIVTTNQDGKIILGNALAQISE